MDTVRSVRILASHGDSCEAVPLPGRIVHDLSQPLTACKFLADELLECAGPGGRTPDVKLALDLQRAIDAQEDLFRSLGLYVRTCQGRYDASRHSVAGMAVADELTAYFSRTFPLQLFRMSGFSDSIRFDSNHASLVTILKCLLDNAGFHARSEVRVSCRQSAMDPRLFRVEILDNGPGVPYQYSGLLGKSFTRIAAPDSRKGGRLGVGLFSAASIATSLEHSLSYTRLDETTCFSLEIRKAAPETHDDVQIPCRDTPCVVVAISALHLNREIGHIVTSLGLEPVSMEQAISGWKPDVGNRPLILVADDRDHAIIDSMIASCMERGIAPWRGAVILQHHDHSPMMLQDFIDGCPVLQLRMPISASRLSAAIASFSASSLRS